MGDCSGPRTVKDVRRNVTQRGGGGRGGCKRGSIDRWPETHKNAPQTTCGPNGGGICV